MLQVSKFIWDYKSKIVCIPKGGYNHKHDNEKDVLYFELCIEIIWTTAVCNPKIWLLFFSGGMSSQSWKTIICLFYETVAYKLLSTYFIVLLKTVLCIFS